MLATAVLWAGRNLSLNYSLGLRGTASLASVGSRQIHDSPVVGFDATTQHMVEPKA